ncbi:hypothetical protein VPNG_10022 [Cytospora leucostoma]|uniref:Uncharacterized protein n=1 Tax=Cytospora leucostoma TaxID=1230097 RepID=A0A423VHP3_9PEZI|nr:hypothetical protein VPNG_10022 [Cytospora leucostoma]
MDSPLLADDASSLPRSPDITPKPAGLASPVPVPSNKNSNRQRRVIRQRAKTPFHDSEDSNDDGKEREEDGRQPTRRPRREVTMAQTMFSELSNINSKPTSPAAKPETHSDSVLLREVSDFQSKASTPAPETATNSRYNLFSEAADIDSRASVALPDQNEDDTSPPHAVKSGASRQTGEYRRSSEAYSSQPEDRRRKGILELVSNNTTSPQPHQRKQRLASDMRGASFLNTDMTGKNVNTFTSRKPVAKTKGAPERDTYEQEDDDQGSNPFSPSAVPPSRGNSPGATKTKRKPASKRKAQRKPAPEQTTKQLVEEASQRQSQPTKAKAKPRRVAPVQKPLDPSSGGESSKGGASTAASDLQEEEEKSIGPCMPRKANFKPLKSPINPDLAATQDLAQSRYDASESPEEEDNMGDDNFEPTSTLSPPQESGAHPKTRATAQSVEGKAARKNCSILKGRDTKSQRRAAKGKPATDDTAIKAELKTIPNQSTEVVTAAKTFASVTDDGLKTQLKKELGSATAAPSQTNKTNRAKQPAKSRVSGSKGQPKKNALISKPAQAQTDRAEPGHGSQDDHSTTGFPPCPNTDEIDLDVLEGCRKSKRIGAASVSQAGNVEALTTDQVKIKTVEKELGKQIPIKTHPRRPRDPVPDPNDPGEDVQDHPVKHRAPGADRSLVVADADEYGESVWEDQTGLSTTFVNLTSDDQEATPPDEGAFGYTDGRDFEDCEGRSVGATGTIALAGNKNRSNVIEHNIPAVLQVNRSPSKSHPFPKYSQMQYATSLHPLKRCFPTDDGASRRKDPNDRRRPSIQSQTRSVFPASLTPRPTDTVVTPINHEPVAKKRRIEVVDTAANSQNDNCVSGSAVPYMPSSDGGDDVFRPQKQSGLAKRTAFVRKCISNQPDDNDPVRVRAELPVQGQPADHITAPSQYQQRDRVLQEPDYVAQKMLAAINAPVAAAEGLMRQSSYDDLDIEQAPDRDSGVSEKSRFPQVPNVDDRKEAWKTATEPYGEGLGEMMHKAVNVILRSLKTKEDSIGDVVDDYGREGRRIVDRISAKHDKERRQLLLQYEQYRLDYIRACKETRHRARETLNGLRSVDLNQVVGEVDRDPIIDRLRELQRTLQKPI